MILIPSNMLMEDEDVFLDDIPLSTVERALDAKCVVTPFEGAGFFEKLRQIERKSR